MIYSLKNGKSVDVRPPRPEDAAELVRVFQTADAETRFLGREPGEFRFTAESEAEMIREVLANPDRAWFLPVYEGRIVGQCLAGIVRSNLRFRHRAALGFVLLRDCWGLVSAAK